MLFRYLWRRYVSHEPDAPKSPARRAVSIGALAGTGAFILGSTLLFGLKLGDLTSLVLGALLLTLLFPPLGIFLMILILGLVGANAGMGGASGA
jgi:hypothetical protein